MKKTAIALAIAGFAIASISQAAPQANTFYAGAKAGWSSAHHGVGHVKNLGFDTHRNSAAGGIFGGYQINDYFATELSVEEFGRFKADKASQKATLNAYGTTLSLKASYPVLKDLDVYARVGAALIRSDYKVDQVKTHKTKVSPVFAGGVEYAITPALAVRAEYQWANKVGKYTYNDKKFSPDIATASLGVSYRFGQVTQAPVVNQVYSFNDDVLFAFGKATLRPGAEKTLDEVQQKIANEVSEISAINVAGYTDRIGSEAYNLKLSQQRADNVAQYLVSKAISPEVITAVGYGEANPVTGNKCDNVKGRKALVACLAPDRRVEINVTGISK
ncbi:porin OmpA [Mergibacter septicus]|uniref:Outer membrane protein A n=1 Tax=Mergibacter septicus TaxID=221402 RepID=A0A8D4IXF0_9PAST|nr:porin OmpA [Mergibacter septicus]AWX15718.1 porin OmpA [Mergibacter septicus]QDJ14971.1 porin OmpA [Mergibacter septicus]UTU47604.1 porin OmpA [Mergibacter septicus]WMR96790.1 porin OmpA [Mergibacter septicus]